jgi:hypothetical protein
MLTLRTNLGEGLPSARDLTNAMSGMKNLEE